MPLVHFIQLAMPLLALALCDLPDSGPYLGGLDRSDEHIHSLIPFPEAAQKTKFLQPFQDAGPGKRYQPEQLPCAGSTVKPATPGQMTKVYHVDALIPYDATKVPGDRGGTPKAAGKPGVFANDANVCKLPQKQGSRRADGSRRCLVAAQARYVAMSDYFYCETSSGPLYLRGYWESADVVMQFNTQTPLQNSENEHVLTSSLGRGDSNVRNPGENWRTFVPGDTFPEERSRFLFFTEATPEDILKMQAVNAENGTYVRCPNGLFHPKADGPC